MDRHRIFQGPDRGWATHGLADFTGHSLGRAVQGDHWSPSRTSTSARARELRTSAHSSSNLGQPPAAAAHPAKTRARNEQNTWPPMVASSYWWKTGRASTMGSTARKNCSTSSTDCTAHSRGVELGVGAQDIFPVKAGLDLHLGLIEPCPHRPSGTAGSPGFRPPAPRAQRLLQGLGFPVSCVGCSLGIMAHHVAPSLDPDLFDPSFCCYLPIAAGASQHQVPDLPLLSQARPQDILLRTPWSSSSSRMVSALISCPDPPPSRPGRTSVALPLPPPEGVGIGLIPRISSQHTGGPIPAAGWADGPWSSRTAPGSPRPGPQNRDWWCQKRPGRIG